MSKYFIYDRKKAIKEGLDKAFLRSTNTKKQAETYTGKQEEDYIIKKETDKVWKRGLKK